ncbi:hypothetical protein RHMOL_Rhmol07G0234300 [Rhododendron molle]|uniref:Uncharacterized protein n=2 Tax=Rhododendron molle TaxID=49168 RepID=A0ACC0N3P0_RHOML|nr:hypothetical protein RHMOL_Rhmol07G0234300 [Rhododendron molle]KAI8547942.1 hypothetical protein RHMOL_Rhmol07G0234300 [Rhododendron molle]
MECQCLSSPHSIPTLYHNGRNFPSTPSLSWPYIPPPLKNPLIGFPNASTSPFTVHCRERFGDEILSTSSAFDVLGVAPNCSPADLKAAFRAKVKKFHPDVRKGGESSDAMIRQVILAYQILSKYSKTEIIERECLDPFEEPECEAFDVFVNEVLCVGKGCPYSCVDRAPHAFRFASSTGTAHATSRGLGEDYKVQLAVGQCPRSCIHYVTPSQRVILEELLDSILDMPYDTSAEAELLYSLIIKARFENNRYQRPKKQPKVSTERVDWL